MKLLRIACVIAPATLLLLFCGLFPSQAQTRISPTFVSVTGSDTATCAQTAPCRTLRRALEVTITGGRVFALSEGDFFSFTVSRSVTLDFTGVGIQITSSSQSIIVDGEGVQLTLKGLALIQSSYPAIDFRRGAYVTLDDVRIVAGSTGIIFDAPDASLALRNVTIVNASRTADAAAIRIGGATGTQTLVVQDALIDRSSRGIVVQGRSNVELSLSDTTVSRSNGDGIYVAPSAGTTKITIQDSQIVSNGGNGVMIAPTGSAKVNAVVVNSALDANLIGLRSFPASPATSTVSISDSSASNNVGGVHASGLSNVGIIGGNVSGNSSYGITAVAPAAIRVGSSMVNGNTLGLSGPVSSYGNNQLLGNTTLGSSTPVAPGSIP